MPFSYRISDEMDLSEEEIERALGPMVSFREQLREEAATYERMRRGDLGALHDLRSTGRWLIGARIARGWTVMELAERLEVSAQQISRDERNEYRGVSAERAQRILKTRDAALQGRALSFKPDTPSTLNSGLASPPLATPPFAKRTTLPKLPIRQCRFNRLTILSTE